MAETKFGVRGETGLLEESRPGREPVLRIMWDLVPEMSAGARLCGDVPEWLMAACLVVNGCCTLLRRALLDGAEGASLEERLLLGQAVENAIGQLEDYADIHH